MNYLRIALNNSQFPFKYEERQVPALIPGLDTANRAPAAFTGSAGNMDWNIPQVIHMENYLPTARGYIGVTYTAQSNSTVGGTNEGNLNVTQTFESGSLGEWSNYAGTVCTVVDDVASGNYAKSMQIQVTGLTFLVSNTAMTVVAGQRLYLEYNNTGPSFDVYLDFYDNVGDLTATRILWDEPKVVPAGATIAYLVLRLPIASTYLLNSINLRTSWTVLDSFQAYSPGAFQTTLTTVQLWGSSGAYFALYKVLFGNYSTVIATIDSIKAPLSATVGGRTYILYHSYATGYKLYQWPWALTAPILPAGLNLDGVVAMVGVNNYLVLITWTAVYWSTPTNPLDFTGYGSGYQTPQDLFTFTITAKSVADGFIIYTGLTAIAVTYTNIPNAPFRFSTVKDASGALSTPTDSFGASAQFVWTSQGLQLVTLQGAQNIAPEVSAALQSKTRTKFNRAVSPPELNVFTANGSQALRLTSVADRYLVISYGAIGSSFQAAYVLDQTLNRWGHLQIKHSVVLDLNLIHSATTLLSYYNIKPQIPIGFITPSGIIHQARTDAEGTVYAEGNALVVGPVSITRQSMTTVQEVQVAAVKAANLEVHVAAALSEFTPSTTTVLSPATAFKEQQTFYGRATGDSLEVRLFGLMDATNLVLGVTKHGK